MNDVINNWEKFIDLVCKDMRIKNKTDDIKLACKDKRELCNKLETYAMELDKEHSKYLGEL